MAIGKLKAINRGYGIDYYWGERWLFVSALRYVGVNIKDNNKGFHQVLWIDLVFGIQYYGRTILTTPKRWQRLFLPKSKSVL